jgi:hypothetical protein
MTKRKWRMRAFLSIRCLTPAALPVLVAVSLAFLSCGRKDLKDTRTEKEDTLAEVLSKKYKVISDWDTSNGYTSHFQRLFIDQNNLMLFKGRVYDIVKLDSGYIVKVLDERKDADHNFLALITFSTNELDEKFTDDKSTSGVFVIKLSKVTASNPSIKEDEVQNGDDDSYSYTHLSDDPDRMLTIFTGKMIDCRFEALPKEK